MNFTYARVTYARMFTCLADQESMDFNALETDWEAGELGFIL